MFLGYNGQFMSQEYIKIKNARVHNLKNLSVDIPKNKLVVITGVSGSGKSSLAFDTIYAEGQRRYVESLSAYARQFLGVMTKPDVDKIEGLSPAIAIDQRSASHNPRSTVATTTEIYDYLRLLFSRVGIPYCPKCGQVLSSQTVSQIVDQIIGLIKRPATTKARAVPWSKNNEVLVLGLIIRGKKGNHQAVLQEVEHAGFVRVRIDGLVYRLEEAIKLNLDRYKIHNIEVVIDRLLVGEKDIDRARIADSVETGLKIGKGIVVVSVNSDCHCEDSAPRTFNKSDGVRGTRQSRAKKLPKKSILSKDLIFSEDLSCLKCQINLFKVEPRTFSFNSPYGACPECQGLGTKLEVDPNLVFPNSRLTIAEGAIRPWANASHRLGRQAWYWWQISRLANEYKFSLNEPIKNLSREVLDLILYGDNKEYPHSSPLTLTAPQRHQSLRRPLREGGRKAEFEGVVPNLQRRWKETQSEVARQEIEKYMTVKTCPICHGKRLRPEALAIKISGYSIDQIVEMSVSQAKELFEGLLSLRNDNNFIIAKPIIKEILNRLQFLIDVGLDYLTLDRSSASLSGGEAQRVKLATQIGSGLSGVIYILDEPSIGLHQRDVNRLIDTLKHLRDLGNSVIMVEHDEQTMRSADWILDIGPGAGISGGELVAQGPIKQIEKAKTLTGDYLSGRKVVPLSFPRRSKMPSRVRESTGIHSGGSGSRVMPGTTTANTKQRYLIVKGAAEHNLKNIDVKIPLGKFVVLSGVSGSGKSTLMNDILSRALSQEFHGARMAPGQYKSITGMKYLNKVIDIDQSAIGRTPRSNPATYIGAFSYVRDLFARSPEAQIRGYKAGRFSFNVKGGRCETCQGDGVKKVEMYFLPDVYVECEVCRGQRYNEETLQIEFNGKNIAQVLQMSVVDAAKFFKNIPGLSRKLRTLNEVGLGYIKLGQAATTLSGGEAQRIKLAKELSRVATGKTLYLLDEPTTGLHFNDVRRLLQVLKKLVSQGNTVLIIEHNLDVIACADWIIDLGPEGGQAGGQIVVAGTAQDIAECSKSWTGKYLKDKLINISLSVPQLTS